MDTTVSPPFVSSAPGLANLRDIGGYPITSTTSVRKSLIYRGPDPAPASPSSLAILHSLKITTVFDLRSQQQIDRAGGHRDLPGIERIWAPVFDASEYTPEKAALRYAQYSAPGTKVIYILLPSYWKEADGKGDRTSWKHLRTSLPTGRRRSGGFYCILHLYPWCLRCMSRLL